MEKKVKFIGFRASPELAEAAKARAKSQHRSLAGYLRFLVEKDMTRLAQKSERA
jgi:predicted DNA-binding protein